MTVQPVTSLSSGVEQVTARIAAIQAQVNAGPSFAQTLAQAAPVDLPATGPATVPAAGTATAAATFARTGLTAATGTAPAPQTAGPAAGPSGKSATGQQAVQVARTFLGVPYEWGGESRTGTDCSGLMLQVFNQLGVQLPRVAADQAHAGQPVARGDLQPGDMVFFDYDGTGIDHVGLYIGHGQMINAPRPGETVKVSPVDWSHYVTARRVLPAADTVSTASADAVSPLPALPAAGQRWAPQIAAAAHTHGVDPALLGALVWSESGFDPAAKSTAGAIGLGQLMPTTAASLGVNPYVPAQNLDGTARYLAAQLHRFGSPQLALAAYNAGPAAVDQYGGVPPYSQTQNYVATVMNRYRTLAGAR